MTIPDTETANKVARIRNYQRQCNGSNEFIRHWMPGGLIYTSGIKLVAEELGAYWLIDLAASHQPAIRRKHKDLAGFQVWNLRKDENPEASESAWVITAWSDTPGADGSKLLARQAIEYSDFPEALSPFEFWVENNTMLLKEER